jgi:hypothetical protein
MQERKFSQCPTDNSQISFREWILFLIYKFSTYVTMNLMDDAPYLAMIFT